MADSANIVREMIDGTAGLRSDSDNLLTQDPAWWEQHRAKLDRVAREAAGS